MIVQTTIGSRLRPTLSRSGNTDLLAPLCRAPDAAPRLRLGIAGRRAQVPRRTSSPGDAGARGPRQARSSPGHSALFLADLPQPPAGLAILGGGARRLLPKIEEIAAADVGNPRRGGEPHERLGTPFGAARQHAEDRHRQTPDQAVVVVEAGRDQTRMQAVRGHAAALEAARELAGEENVCKLA